MDFVVLSALTLLTVRSDDVHFTYAPSSTSCHLAAPTQWGTPFQGCNPIQTHSWQSPIDLDDYTVGDADLVQYYEPVVGAVVNNGHAVQFTPQSKSKLTTTIPSVQDGSSSSELSEYLLQQLHFHWQKDGDGESGGGSEHSIQGAFYPMEMHMVHHAARYDSVEAAIKDGKDDGVLVVGIMFEVMAEADCGPSCGELDIVLDTLNHSVSTGDGLVYSGRDGLSVSPKIDPCKFLPEGECDADGLEDFFHYIGGLTTPPCTSGSGGLVRWVVDADTVGMTSKQLEFLQTSIMTRPETEKGEAVTISTFGNSRPLQQKGDRSVWWSGDDSVLKPSTTSKPAPVDTKVNANPLAQCSQDSVEGYLVDNLCLDEAQEALNELPPTMHRDADFGESGRLEDEGLWPLLSPEKHDKSCLLMDACVKSGYSIVTKIEGREDAQGALYEVQVILDDAGNERATAMIQDAEQLDNFFVVASGTRDGGVLINASVVLARTEVQHTTDKGMLIGVVLLISFSTLAIMYTVFVKHRQAMSGAGADLRKGASFDNPLATTSESIQVKEMSEA